MQGRFQGNDASQTALIELIYWRTLIAVLEKKLSEVDQLSLKHANIERALSEKRQTFAAKEHELTCALSNEDKEIIKNSERATQLLIANKHCLFASELEKVTQATGDELEKKLAGITPK